MNQEQRKQYLSLFHTKTLLRFLKASRGVESCYIVHGQQPQMIYVISDTTRDGYCALMTAELKEILSTREHIPNKQEAKLIRQQKQFNKQKR